MEQRPVFDYLSLLMSRPTCQGPPSCCISDFITMRLHVAVALLVLAIQCSLFVEVSAESWAATGLRTKADIIRDLKNAQNDLRLITQQM